MICEEKQGLLEAYQAVTRQYSVAVTELLQKIAVSKTDYDALYQRTEALHQNVDCVDAVRLRYKTHVGEHRC
jgi:predicted component of type VI protein secretion system